MKLSISNIAWVTEDDESIYSLMKELSFTGLEIAPTRIFPNTPYDRLDEASKWREHIRKDYGFEIPSMQSIWYGRKELVFGSEEERKALIDYTKKAIDFAAVTGCGNLVFGCPKNRNVPEGKSSETGVGFFREICDYAAEKGTFIGIEANPVIYGTNYITGTEEAIELIKNVDSPGCRLNVDVGTMIHNNESAELLEGRVNLVSHVHISEPGLKPIEDRPLHRDLIKVLRNEGYNRYVSIEMGKTEDTGIVADRMRYLRSIIG